MSTLLPALFVRYTIYSPPNYSLWKTRNEHSQTVFLTASFTKTPFFLSPKQTLYFYIPVSGQLYSRTPFFASLVRFTWTLLGLALDLKVDLFRS